MTQSRAPKIERRARGAERGPHAARRPFATMVLCLGLGFGLSACMTPEGGLSALQSGKYAPPAGEPKPRNVTYLQLGNHFLSVREPDLALKAFQTSLNVEGVTAEAMNGAGIAARQQGLATSARRYLEHAVELAPDSAVAHYNLGVVLYQLKEYHAARNAFRSAFALSSGTNQLAEQQLNRTEEIVALLEKQPEKDPTISHDVVRLGGGQFKLVAADPVDTEVLGE